MRAHFWLITASIGLGGAVALGLAVAAGPTPDAAVRDLMADPAIEALRTKACGTEAATIDDQIAFAEIPSPPFKEAQRAAAVRVRLAALGLRNVHQDAVGNTIAERPGRAAHPSVVLSAHLDSVFPEGTDVRTRRAGSGISGPGIADDARGLAVVLAVVRLLNEQHVQTDGTLTVAATVGEEGLGDLRGAKHLLQETLKGRVDDFLAIDGGGEAITTTGVGSMRYRVTFRGPGGHSFGAFGLPNPVNALGRAISQIADFDVPSDPRVTFNVGRIGGGTSINAIPEEAWMEVDMRSSDETALGALDAKFRAAVDRALVSERERWSDRHRLTVETTVVGDRPPGRTSANAPIVRLAVATSRALGLASSLDEGSTDANVGMSLGVPAITLGGGGRVTGGHSLAERFDATDSCKGTERALLTTLALLGYRTVR